MGMNLSDMCWPWRDFKKLYIPEIWNFALTEFYKILQFCTIWLDNSDRNFDFLMLLIFKNNFLLAIHFNLALCLCMKMFVTFMNILSNTLHISCHYYQDASLQICQSWKKSVKIFKTKNSITRNVKFLQIMSGSAHGWNLYQLSECYVDIQRMFGK